MKKILKCVLFMLMLPLVLSCGFPLASVSASSISPQTEPEPEDLHHYWFEPIYFGADVGIDGHNTTNGTWRTNNKTDTSISFTMEGEGELTVSYDVYDYKNGWKSMHSVVFTESGAYDYKMGYYPTFPDRFYTYRVSYSLKAMNGPVSIFGDIEVDYYDRWIPTGDFPW